MRSRSITFHPAPVSLRVRCRTTPEQDRMLYLAGRRAIESQMAMAWFGHMISVYRPITCSDGSYWRNGRWNEPAK